MREILDPEGAAWQAEADRRWRAAERRAAKTGVAPTAFYDPPPLPHWTAPPHVQRPLFGRFLLDRDTNVLHDATRATEACDLDAVRNATFIHFAHEIDHAAPGAVRCEHCLR
jgi:hypothetical protein